MPDIAPGYTFTSGDTVTHSKLNSAASGTIDASFYTGKGTLASYSASACTVLVYDGGTSTYKRGTLANVFFSSDELIKNRSASTTPPDTYLFLAQDPSGGMYKVTRANIFYQWLSLAGMLDAAGALGSTSGSALKVLVDGSTIEIATNALQIKAGGVNLSHLATQAKRDLAGAIAHFVHEVAANTAADASATSATALSLNSTLTNTLTGCSLNTGTGRITLPVGRYEVTLTAYTINGVRGYVDLYNYTDTAVQTSLSGSEIRAMQSTGTSGGSVLTTTAIFEVTGSSKDFQIRGRASAVSTWGWPLNLDGKAERYQSVLIRQAY